MKRFTRWIEGVLGAKACRAASAMRRGRTLGFERCEPRLALSTSAAALMSTALEPQTPIEGHSFEGGFVDFMSMQSTRSIVTGYGVTVWWNADGSAQPFVWRQNSDMLSSPVPRGMTTDDASLDHLFVDGASESSFFEEKSSGIEVIPPPAPAPGPDKGSWEGGAVAVNHFVNPDGLLPASGPGESGGSIAARSIGEGDSPARGAGAPTASPIEGLRSRAVMLQVAEAGSANEPASLGSRIAEAVEGDVAAVLMAGDVRLALAGMLSFSPSGDGHSAVGGGRVTVEGAPIEGTAPSAAVLAAPSPQIDDPANVQPNAEHYLQAASLRAFDSLSDGASPETPPDGGSHQADAAAKDAAIGDFAHEAAALETAASPRNHRIYWMALASVIGGAVWTRRRRTHREPEGLKYPASSQAE